MSMSREEKKARVERSERVQSYRRELVLKQIQEKNERIEALKKEKKKMSIEKRYLSEQMKLRKDVIKHNRNISKEDLYKKIFNEQPESNKKTQDKTAENDNKNQEKVFKTIS